MVHRHWVLRSESAQKKQPFEWDSEGCRDVRVISVRYAAVAFAAASSFFFFTIK
jgi:hypothetical protein